MKKVAYRLLVIAFCVPLLFSCKKDPTYCSTDWAVELQNELTAVSNALVTYSMNPTDANCYALKDAYQDYIDALKPYGKCENLTGQSRDEWQKALDQAEEDIDNMC